MIIILYVLVVLGWMLLVGRCYSLEKELRLERSSSNALEVMDAMEIKALKQSVARIQNLMESRLNEAKDTITLSKIKQDFAEEKLNVAMRLMNKSLTDDLTDQDYADYQHLVGLYYDTSALGRIKT